MPKVQPIRPEQAREIEVHPYAAAYRMHSAEEFQLLCERIERNGLRDPITLDRDGRIIDGRNRHKACLRLGIEPRFVTFDGDDEAIAEFVSDRNEANKSLTTGQKAIGYAITHQREQGGRGKKNPYSSVRVSEARLILEYAPEIVEQVVSGARTFNSTLEEAKRRKADRENVDQSMADLEAGAPDLAALVANGSLSLSDALGAARAREEEKQSKAKLRTQFLHETLANLAAMNDDFLTSIDSRRWPEVALVPLNPTTLDKSIAALHRVKGFLFGNQGAGK
jgi:hypothetical protein